MASTAKARTYRYISSEGAAAIRAYAYKGEDRSLIYRVRAAVARAHARAGALMAPRSTC
jgi:hypothetical protein